MIVQNTLQNHQYGPQATQSANISAPLLAVYTNYREYLRDFYNYRRKATSRSLRPYTYSDFSAAADIKSPNYLKLIIEGKRNLSEQMMLKFAKALKLNKSETMEFCALVKYGQSVEPMEKNQNLKVLAELRAEKNIEQGKISRDQWEKTPNWIAWVIYAMLDQKDFQLDAEKIQNLFLSQVGLEQIKQSINDLIEKQQVVRSDLGRWVKNRDNSKKETVPSEVVKKLQSELIYLGLESLFRDDSQEREFGAATLTLTEQEFEKVRFELRKMRKQIQKDNMVARENSAGDRVYQLNIQLYPLTQKA